MPRRFYKIVLLTGLSAVILAIPAFWFSYPLLEDAPYSGRAAGKLEVVILDVGQGDAILARTPAGQNILIDGGPDKKAAKAVSARLPAWDRTIDLMILTHPHDDHVSGLVEALRRFTVGRVLLTGVVHTSPAYLAFLEEVRDRAIETTIIDRPQTIGLGPETSLEIIYPLISFDRQAAENLNNTSIAVRLSCGRTAFLFAGDLEEAAEAEIIAAGADIGADVLKVGHHGSDTSSSEDWLEAVGPAYAVISVGADNRFGHPSRRVLKRLERTGARILRTDLDGAAVFISDGAAVSLARP